MLNTSLKDRILWFDGDSCYHAADITKLISKYDIKYVDNVLEPLVQQYNRHVEKSAELRQKNECNPLDKQWNIPSPCLLLDVFEHVISKHIEMTTNLPPNVAQLRDVRLLEELAQYQQRDLFDMLRAIIYLVRILDSNHVVRGIGRGSSVSSYVLYVIGVHDVDSFTYDLDFTEFLHD